MRQNFKTGTTGGSPGDEEREGDTGGVRARQHFANGRLHGTARPRGRVCAITWSPYRAGLATDGDHVRARDLARASAGWDRAGPEGGPRPHGRPPTAALKADEVLRLKAEQVSHSEIARRLGIGRTSVRRILAAG
ncbi:MAG: helix-turn-helix domain-containing protein [Isosphaeraceae bacterium]